MKIIVKSIVIIFVLTLGGFLFLLTTHVGGWKGFIVMSASMEPGIPTGSLVITQQIPPKELEKGDVITFVRPDNTKELITHRIETITQKPNLTTIKTKGDKNPYADNWILAGGGVIGKVYLTIPYLGYLLTFTQSKLGILLFILIPAVYIIIEEIKFIVKLFNRRKPESQKEMPVKVEVLSLFILASIITSHSFVNTKALIIDNSELINNRFTISSITPTPDCEEDKR